MEHAATTSASRSEMSFIWRWIIRLAGPCPLHHRSDGRIRRVDVAGQAIYFDCDLCGRQTSEALSGHPKGEKIAPATAVKANWFDGMRKRA